VRGGKSSNATNVLQTVRIPKFNPRRQVHRQLALLAGQAATATALDPTHLAISEVAIDDAAAELWSLPTAAKQAMREALALFG